MRCPSSIVVTGLLLGMAAAGAGCGGGDAARDSARDAPRAGAPAVDGRDAGPEPEGRPSGDHAPRSGRAGPSAPGDSGAGRDTSGGDGRPLRRYRFRLVNASPEALHVFAEAGKGEVVLDTVAPADSGELWVETRARSLRLRAATEGGRTVREDTLDLREGELNRWRAAAGG